MAQLIEHPFLISAQIFISVLWSSMLGDYLKKKKKNPGVRVRSQGPGPASATIIM